MCVGWDDISISSLGWSSGGLGKSTNYLPSLYISVPYDMFLIMVHKFRCVTVSMGVV